MRKSLDLRALAGIGWSLPLFIGALFFGALSVHAADAVSNGAHIDVAQSAACQECLDKCKSDKLSPTQKKACVDACYTKSKVCTFDNSLRGASEVERMLSAIGLGPVD